MNYIEIERDDIAVKPWAWAHQRQPQWHPPTYAPPVPMSGPKRMAFIAKLPKAVKADWRHRPLTELAARAILSARVK